MSNAQLLEFSCDHQHQAPPASSPSSRRFSARFQERHRRHSGPPTAGLRPRYLPSRRRRRRNRTFLPPHSPERWNSLPICSTIVVPVIVRAPCFRFSRLQSAVCFLNELDVRGRDLRRLASEPRRHVVRDGGDLIVRIGGAERRHRDRALRRATIGAGQNDLRDVRRASDRSPPRCPSGSRAA